MLDDEFSTCESSKDEEGDNEVTEDIKKKNKNNSDERKNWGKGIPRYIEEDLMTKEELLDFAMQIVKQFELDKKGFELVSANNKLGIYPNFVVRKDNTLLFILVKADIAPRMPELTEDDKKIMIEQSKKYDAIPLFAPVGFGSTDPERFDKSIALRGDSFYSNYVGLEEIK